MPATLLKLNSKTFMEELCNFEFFLDILKRWLKMLSYSIKKNKKNAPPPLAKNNRQPKK